MDEESLSAERAGDRALYVNGMQVCAKIWIYGQKGAVYGEKRFSVCGADGGHGFFGDICEKYGVCSQVDPGRRQIWRKPVRHQAAGGQPCGVVWGVLSAGRGVGLQDRGGK